MTPKYETVDTLHPDRRKGTRIGKREYELMREFIFTVLKAEKEILFAALVEKATAKFHSGFHGNVPWYLLIVKLDLEARGILKRRVPAGPGRLPLLKLKPKKR